MSEPLKPCPFCGEQDHVYPTYIDGGRTGPVSIDCLGCGIDFTPRNGVNAKEAWNRRSPSISNEGE